MEIGKKRSQILFLLHLPATVWESAGEYPVWYEADEVWSELVESCLFVLHCFICVIANFLTYP